MMELHAHMVEQQALLTVVSGAALLCSSALLALNIKTIRISRPKPKPGLPTDREGPAARIALHSTAHC